MPVARSSGHASRALLVTTVGVVVLVLGLYGLAVLVGRQEATEVSLGDQAFELGDAEDRAAEIADRGPALFSDVAGGDRDIVLQHLGPDARTGWLAFSAQPPDQARDCFWQWQPGQGRFQASCDEALTLPTDGQGALQYPVTVDADGSLSVDLNAANRPTTALTTTSIPISGR